MGNWEAEQKIAHTHPVWPRFWLIIMGMRTPAMGGGWERVLLQLPNSLCRPWVPPLFFASACTKKPSKTCPFCPSLSPNSSKLVHGEFGRSKCFRPSGDQQSETVRVPSVDEDEDVIGRKQEGSRKSKLGDDIQSGGAAIGEAFLQGNSAILSACVVGLLTGITVVLFNNAVSECSNWAFTTN